MSAEGEARSVTAVIIFFIVSLMLFFLYLRIRNYAIPSSSPGLRFASPVQAHRHALDPAVVQSLPVTIYSSEDSIGCLQCVVCLSELADGEAVHLLPGCGHGFHLECIDTWFRHNDTCPLCRSTVCCTPGNDAVGESSRRVPGAVPELVIKIEDGVEGRFSEGIQMGENGEEGDYVVPEIPLNS